MSQSLKLALISLDLQWHSPRKNYDHAEVYIAKAKQSGADGVVLPEMFATGFSMDASQVSEELEGETWQFLQRMAKEYKIGVAGGFTRRISSDNDNAKCLQNIVTFFESDGSEAGTAVKVHPFTFAGESEIFVGGEKTTVIEWLGWNIGGLICYDLRFPEAFRMVADEVECFIVPANWPSPRIEHWHSLLKARSIENQCYVVGVNRTGIDGNKLEYVSSSTAHDPMGKTVQPSLTEGDLQIVELHKNLVLETREKLPFLQDRKLI